MYVDIDTDSLVNGDDVVGIFDLDNTTVSRHTRKMLNEAEKAGRVISVTDDLPKAFVVTTPPGKKTAENRVYLCQLSTGTLRKRSGK